MAHIPTSVAYAFNFDGTWALYQQTPHASKMPNAFFSGFNYASKITQFFAEWLRLYNLAQTSVPPQTEAVRLRRAEILLGLLNLMTVTNIGYLKITPAGGVQTYLSSLVAT
jgi:hypothetical protein